MKNGNLADGSLAPAYYESMNGTCSIYECKLYYLVPVMDLPHPGVWNLVLIK